MGKLDVLLWCPAAYSKSCLRYFPWISKTSNVFWNGTARAISLYVISAINIFFKEMSELKLESLLPIGMEVLIPPELVIAIAA